MPAHTALLLLLSLLLPWPAATSIADSIARWQSAARAAPAYANLSSAALLNATGCGWLEGPFTEEWGTLNSTRWNASALNGLDRCSLAVLAAQLAAAKKLAYTRRFQRAQTVCTLNKVPAYFKQSANFPSGCGPPCEPALLRSLYLCGFLP